MKRKDATVLKAIEQINAQYGKEMPQAVEIERAILGALLNDETLVGTVSGIINPESFYENTNKLVFETILALHDKKHPVDLMTVTKELKDTGKLDEVGGPTEITALLKNKAYDHKIEHYCRIVEQEKIRRNLIRMSAQVMADAYDGSIDVHDVIIENQKDLHNLQLIPFDSLKKAPQMIQELYARMKYNYNHDGAITGMPYGIKSLDRFTSGIQTTDLTIIAGEPSMGKTSMAVTIANNLTRDGNKAGVISLEMASLQIVARIAAQETGISSKSILAEKLDDKQLAIIDSVAKEIEQRHLFVDPDVLSDLGSIVASIRFMNEKLGVRVFFIDYLQLITVPQARGNREEQLANVSRTLKNLAKELDVAIIALSQLNRDSNKKELPSMRRLRGSGQIEEAADNIIFVHRPEYHGQEFMPDDDTTLAEGKALLIIAKGRNIGITQLTVNFEKTTGLFSEDKISYDFGDYNPDQFHSPDSPF